MSEYRTKTLRQHIEETKRDLLESAIPDYEKKYLESYERMGLRPDDTMYDVYKKIIQYFEKNMKNAKKETILRAIAKATLSPDITDSHLWTYRTESLPNELRRIQEWHAGFKNMLPDLAKEMNIKINLEEFYLFVDEMVSVAEKMVNEHIDMRMGKS